MVIKVYLSGLSGSKEIKKRQQRVLLLLDTAKVNYEPVDITEPGKEEIREFLQKTCKQRDNKSPVPPQFFNDDIYCGDYEDFELAADVDKLFSFLKIEADSSQDDILLQDNAEPKSNGDYNSRTEDVSKDDHNEGDDIDSGNADSNFGNDGNGKSVEEVKSKSVEEDVITVEESKELSSENDELEVDLEQPDTVKSDEGDDSGAGGTLKRKSKDGEKARDEEDTKKQKVESDEEEDVEDVEDEEVEDEEVEDKEVKSEDVKDEDAKDTEIIEEGKGDEAEVVESSAEIVKSPPDDEGKESDAEEIEDEPELEDDEPKADKPKTQDSKVEAAEEKESEGEEEEEEEEEDDDEVESE